jgi:hypothetical protein
MRKALMKLGIEGVYLNIIKAIHDKPIPKVILNSKKQNISPRVKNETSMPTLSTLFSIVLEFLTKLIRQEEEIKGINVVEKVKQSLFADDMILYLKDLENS